ncbi:glycosyltransferase family 25 protein [Sphaerotilus uruguayifluvii]|uniref:Glycosyl transferase family 25 n=1 Tax=Sphaerotilus uruguayifluvii TaxID=2735897 RepID=A0ABX2GAP9_9BURK|nr:glycosyltransferase family 25 protein [Leptothrix sp. C29]NRT58640.1 glycosyl transferase family 25 [Leptothrix sp. C29]
MSIKKYVISLEGAEQRRRDLKFRVGSSFDEINIINAVDGRKFFASDYFLNLQRARYFLSPSELGCTLSHIEVYKNAILSGEKSVVIMEDDVIVDREGLFRCDEIARRIPADGICILGGQDGLKSRKWIIGRLSPELGSNVYSIPRVCWKQVWRTCAYIAGDKALEMLLKKQQDGFSKADDWDYLCGKGIKIFFTEIVRHPIELNASSIESERLKSYGNRSKNGFFPNVIKKILYIYERKFIYARIFGSLFYLIFGFVFVPRRKN